MAIDPSSSTPFSKSDDLALVQGVLDRRQEALAELYDRYAPLLLAGIAAVARARVTDRDPLLAVALAGCVMVPPVVWNHTLVLTLPLQAMAIALARQRYRAAAAVESGAGRAAGSLIGAPDTKRRPAGCRRARSLRRWHRPPRRQPGR